MGILMGVAAQTWNTTCIPSHDRLWVNTHPVLLTLSFSKSAAIYFCLFFSRSMTHTEIVGGVCLWNVSHSHSTFHGLRRDDDVDHVQMIFFTPLRVVQHSPNTFCSCYRTHIFPSCCPYFCLRSSLWCASQIGVQLWCIRYSNAVAREYPLNYPWFNDDVPICRLPKYLFF